MGSPTFSVVIPVFNRAGVIGDALLSVLRQTYQEFEIIVVDDGSTDDLRAAVAALDDPRIRIIEQEKGGANVARNRGIDAARGSHVAFLDSDDRYLPHHLEAVASIVSSGYNGAVYARVIVDRGEGLSFMKPPRAIGRGEHMADYLLRDRGFVQTSTLVVPTNRAREIRYREGMPFGQDTDFAIRLYNAGVPFHMLPEPSAVWADHYDPTRVSSTVDPLARENWLGEMRAQLPKKAYLADRGWFLAKAYARSQRRGKAFGLCARAILHGCYSPRFAAVVALQVLLPAVTYRVISDFYLRWRQ